MRQAETATAERARIAAILNCPEALGRERSAILLALEPTMSVEKARTVLSGATPARLDFDRGKHISRSLQKEGIR
jgi:hypothetical protein